MAWKVGQDLSACDGRLSIWDFEFDRSDGSSVLVHPRSWSHWKSLEFAALEECPQVPVMPTAGPGGSSGSGTYITAALCPAPSLPPSSPSPPSLRVFPTDQAQPPPSPLGGLTRVPTKQPPPPSRRQVAVAPPVGGQAVLCLFALCEWPLHAVAFAEVITNVACTRGRGVLSGRLSLGLPQLQQKPAEHHSHADEIQELWGVWRRG